MEKHNDQNEYFKTWKKYEDIAMHFNDLIIRLRTQSIGGIAALAAILGIFLTDTNSNNDITFNYGLASIALIILILFWIAVWILDLRYYNRLLEGSVNAILLLEKNKEEFLENKEINLSTNIENAFNQRFAHEPKGLIKRFLLNARNLFYSLVFIGLFLGFVFSFSIYINNKPSKSPNKDRVSNVKLDASLSGSPDVSGSDETCAKELLLK